MPAANSSAPPLSAPDETNKTTRGSATTTGTQQENGQSTNQLQGASSSGSSRLVFGLSSRTNRLKHDEYAESRRNSTSKPSDIHSPKSKHTNMSGTSEDAASSPAASSQLKIRPSRYGNHYKPLDSQQPKQQQQPEQTASSGKQQVQQPAESKDTSRMTGTRKRSQSPSSKASASPEATKTEPTKTEPTKTVRRKSVDKGVKNAAEKAVEKPKEPPTNETKKNTNIDEVSEKKPAKMMFSIPPPPKMSSSLAGQSKGSVVSYAKSRIYDKPSRQQLLNSKSLVDGSSSILLELRGGADIPKSILSGFKPPKQVNVSKAREDWEVGEPFTRCKSRQRLAAQAGKKLLHGAWSMTSVVATQQLQLQQALVASASPTARYSSRFAQTETPVKVLTRGSVLERVQQFERVPSTPSLGSSLGESSSNSSLASNSSVSSDDRSTSSSTSGDSDEADSASEASITIKPNPKVKCESKQAKYKHKVSSLQNSANNPPLDPVSALLSGSTGGSAGYQSPPRSPTVQEGGFGFPGSKQPAPRRLSLRRRSSTTSNSSYANIPKFYHPHGKPNTYEIEVQKKNIVAAFDKLPERRALLDGSPAGRRHFHSIALACGFSEYFKVPLCAYIKHRMTNSNLLHSASANPSGIQRKHSAANLSSTGTQSNKPQPSSIPRKTSVTATNQTQTAITTNESKLPSMKPLARAASVDTPTMEKLSGQNYVTCDQFLICWLDMIGKCFDLPSKFVHLLAFGERNYLIPDDFVPLIQSIIDDHPGLKFLRAAPDFHMRYIQTVIARIYFCVNKSWTGKISVNELRYSNLLAVLQVLSQEDDINQITDYFSYEHFYVIYCKFWSLDQDHDLLISKEDLARHNDAAISSRIIDRIFSGIVSKQIQKTGKMSYTDFVWFLIAEEDKKHPRSIEYWFRLIDIDGDGYISMYEMEYFYYEQVRRLELMNIEALPFLDSACQILDLVNPREKNKISLSDLKKTKMATIFFDTFVNLEKYLEHESREFVSTRDVVQDGVVISDWDRYASEEYELLVAEETNV